MLLPGPITEPLAQAFLQHHGHVWPTYPYVNALVNYPLHFFLVETVFISVSVLVALTVALPRGKRELQLVAAQLVFALWIESMAFAMRSHVHAQFFLQLTHFLPLKEACWYICVVYNARWAAKWSNLPLFSQRAVLAGLLSALQNVNYEMTNSRPGIGIIWMNLGMTHANFTQRLNAGCAAPMLSIGICGMACFVLAETTHPLVFALVGVPVFIFCHLPMHLLQYMGCSHVLTTDWAEFHARCSFSSEVTQPAILYFAGVASCVLLLRAFIQRERRQQQQSVAGASLAEKHVLLISATAIHLVLLACWILAQDQGKATSGLVLGTNCLAHLGLLVHSLDVGRRVVAAKNKEE